MNDIDSLNRQFGIPNAVVFEAGQGGLTRLIIQTDAADAELYLHGAHLTAYQPRGEKPVLFMSAKSLFSPAKAIRGGVPICFPWFGPKPGDPKAAAHGFARLMEWSVESVRQADDGSVSVTLALQANEIIRTQWPAEFKARYTVTVGSMLHMELAVINNGQTSIQFQEAFHTYLTVGDVHQVSITGLESATYIDKMNNAALTPQANEPIRFTGETDRVYLATRTSCTVHDPSLGRQIQIDKTGSDTTVVWNPWINKSRSFSDFGDEEWLEMVCVETCNVADYAVSLLPGATHVMTAIVSAKTLRS